jgi:1,4-dihydroxy-2-naphthoate octaprenyltransferase
MKQSTLLAIFGPMRLPFLVLTPVCVILGAATAVWMDYEIRLIYFIFVLIGAVSAHISVNALNEYDDFITGLDFRTKRTPFSGGSGTLPAFPEKARYALITGLTALAVTVLVGIYFLVVRGIGLLPIGLLGVILVVGYTRWFTRNPILCLLVPGLGFGTLMVMGTYFALTGAYSWQAFTTSLVPFFLVSNLLLLNQVPDTEADKSIGRKHLLITSGKKTGVLIYGLFLGFTYLSVLGGYGLKLLPWQSLLALMSLFVAIPTMVGIYRHVGNAPRLTPFMGLNVLLNLLTPLLLATGLFLA